MKAKGYFTIGETKGYDVMLGKVYSGNEYTFPIYGTVFYHAWCMKNISQDKNITIPLVKSKYQWK